MKHIGITLVVLVVAFTLIAIPCFAQEHAEEQAEEAGGLGLGLKFIASALAVGLCALGTGFAQSRIGSAGVGAIVEKPDTTGVVIILLAIPETMVILGFVVAAMIIIL